MSEIQFNPYLFFKGDCRKAIEFYKEIFGGKVQYMTYGDAGGVDGIMPADNIMHAYLESPHVVLMASDTPKASSTIAKVALSLSGDDAETLTRIFNELSDGGVVDAPLKKEMWGDVFGTLTDKFGIEWMVNISAPTQQKV